MYLVIKSCLQLLKMHVSFLNGSQVASFLKVGGIEGEDLSRKILTIKKQKTKTKKQANLQIMEISISINSFLLFISILLSTSIILRVPKKLGGVGQLHENPIFYV